MLVSEGYMPPFCVLSGVCVCACVPVLSSE